MTRYWHAFDATAWPNAASTYSEHDAPLYVADADYVAAAAWQSIDAAAADAAAAAIAADAR